jgi:hypothetical protein
VTATDAATGALSGNATVSVSPTGSGALVFHSANTPVALNPSNVFVESVITVPQSVTIASQKVQVNITYPMDSDLGIDLVYIDSAGFQRASVTLSYFVGTGANFQGTIFDDTAATPIAAGTSPFAGSYRPSDSLSAFVGLNAQGTWALEVGDYVGGSGIINSWSLIIQPAGSPMAPAGTALRVSEPSLIAALPPTASVSAMAPNTAADLFTSLRSGLSPLTPAADGIALASPTVADQIVARPGGGLNTPADRHVRAGHRSDPISIMGAGLPVNDVDGDVVP